MVLVVQHPPLLRPKLLLLAYLVSRFVLRGCTPSLFCHSVLGEQRGLGVHFEVKWNTWGILVIMNSYSTERR